MNNCGGGGELWKLAVSCQGSAHISISYSTDFDFIIFSLIHFVGLAAIQNSLSRVWMDPWVQKQLQL